MITSEQAIKLIDFGLATTEQYPVDFDCGSKPYMSYECHNPDYPNYDAFQADIWSLGIIFINLFWHRSPWSRPDDSCPAYKSFCQNPTDFLLERFDGMSRSVATFLSDRVFCSEKKGRVRTAEWRSWCKNLVKLLSDDNSRPTTPKKTIGFLPLSISLSTVRNNSTSKSKESALSARIRRSSFFSILPPSPISPNKSATPDEGNKTTIPDCYFSSHIDLHAKSWSQEFDFDTEGGEMDFSEPISFADANSVPTPNDEPKKDGQDDNDSGFGSDETDGNRQSFDSGHESPATVKQHDSTSNVPKYVPPAKRRDYIPPMDIRDSSKTDWKRYSTSTSLSALPSSVGGQGYHVGAQHRRPFAPPQPSWRIKHQRQETRQKSSNVNHQHPISPNNDMTMRHNNPSLSFFNSRKSNENKPVSGYRDLPTVPVYKLNRSSNTFTSASVSLFNNRMPGMTTYKSLSVSSKDTTSAVQISDIPAEDLEMSEMDVVFGEDQIITPTTRYERRNHLTKGAISDFGKLLRSIARDRSQ